MWSLDRATFNNIVKNSASKKREKYENFLGKVKLLQTMDAYERSKLSDAFKEVSFKPGEFIIREGEEGKEFFIVEEGEAKATKVLHDGEEPTVVM